MMHRILVLTVLIHTIILTSGQTAHWNWASQVIGNDWSIADDIETDNQNNVYSCGFFMDSASFGNNHLYYDMQTAFIVILVMNSSGMKIRDIPSVSSSIQQIRINFPGLYLVSVFTENQVHSRKIIITPGDN